MKLAKEALVMGSLLLLAICSQSSVITLDWDPNPETNLTGYRLFASTSVSMVSMSTQAAVANNRITKILLPVTTTYSAFIPAGTTYYTRLTARNSNGESGFNVDSGGNPHELLVWLKPGDVNKDGTVGIVDLSMLIAYWNETNRREADFNNDGLVGIVDLSILIASWGQ